MEKLELIAVVYGWKDRWSSEGLVSGNLDLLGDGSGKGMRLSSRLVSLIYRNENGYKREKFGEEDTRALVGSWKGEICTRDEMREVTV